jgi:hypothetical protein
MNTYTFTYYGWIPSYGDFDQEWFEVEAASLLEAKEKVGKMKLIIKGKGGPGLDMVNGIDVKDLTPQQVIDFKL